MRLLLAEDEYSLSRALTAILEHSGYAVDTAGDGEQAIALLTEHNYDGIILDIMMPKKSGLEVLQALRGRGDLTPVLLLTAKAEVDDKVAGLDLGANDYLTKPFDSRELLARLRAILRVQSPSPAVSVLTVGGITLDRTTFEVSSATASFRLSRQEAQMLELFLLNPGQHIPAERFLERIWRMEETDPQIVPVYVSYLRKKLESLRASVKILDTESGYALEAEG